MLEEATAAARNTGRGHVADYLDLRARNDALRAAGVRLLFEAVVRLAGDAGRDRPGIQIEREEPHNFPHAGANMAGSLLRVRHGLRCLTIEAGWTRTPADGFMRGGALAVAKISHFGIAKMNMDLLLRASDVESGWIARSPDGREAPVDEVLLHRHFSVFLGD